MFLSILRADLGPLSVLVLWVGEVCVSVVNEYMQRIIPDGLH